MTSEPPKAALNGEDISVAIRIFRPALIILMCLAHIPMLQGYSHASVNAGLPTTVLGPFLSDVLSRGAVPMLTVISGFLAYQSYSKKSYARFVGDKSQRILVPFLVWNAIVLLYLALLNHVFERDLGGHLARIGDLKDLVLVLVAYNATPVNVPTYFLRDLFVILLAVPLISLATQNRILGAVVCFLLIALSLTVLPLFLSVGGHGILYRNDMPFFFVLGFLIARHQPSIPRPATLPSALGAAALLVVSVGVAFWLASAKPPIEQYVRFRPLIGLLLIALSPFLISLIVAHGKTVFVVALDRLSRYSYTIFLSHIMVAYYIGGGLSDPASRWFQSLNMSNQSPLWMQVLYVMTYLILCIGLGVAIKTFYDCSSRSVRWLALRQSSRFSA